MRWKITSLWGGEKKWNWGRPICAERTITQKKSVDGRTATEAARLPGNALQEERREKKNRLDSHRPSHGRTLKAHLYAHWRQVVVARKIIDIRAQSSPVSFRLCAVISLAYDLVDAARAVHDLFHCSGHALRWKG